ncbi:uncharacterized protein PV07_05968 [Cladophialophora immunda]|uniref:SnoaL-like domain-containing protein n=1 Tax=Cladophialophora immunda TaxID=569365 RepID=A0A0D2D3B3_9EURO|nr:uncharacterized protein PV07_05968 [Cladophialophora immunda]KIW30209.1 hypothetical protein PV07_05968 [Cladophialophora immunda]
MTAITNKKTTGEWHYLGDLTTLDNLHATLSFPMSAFHKPELKKEEEEIFQHYADWMLFNDTRFAVAPQEGTRFYDCDQVLYYDMMGLIPPYYAKSHIGYKDMEVIAASPDMGFVNMFQAGSHYWGTTTDGHDFDFKFRYTGILRKKDGIWKWIEEHVSFPVNVATQKGDLTCSLDAGENLRMDDKDNEKRGEENFRKAKDYVKV